MSLFDPGKIGNMSLRNRIIMAPIATGGLSAPDGSFSPRIRAYYAARAKGGTGLIITGATYLTTSIEGKVLPTYSLMLDSREKFVGLNELAQEIHNYGAKLCVQLTIGSGRIGGVLHGTTFPPVSASAVPSFFFPETPCRMLTVEEINTLINAFGNAAYLCKQADVDSIEIHGYGGYLLDQFKSSIWNTREDEYGGDLNGRMRLSMEIINAIKKNCGNDFPILYKFTPEHFIKGGRDLREGLEIALMLEGAGVSALHVNMGCYENRYLMIPPIYSPPAGMVELAGKVKEVVNIPVIVDGKLGDPLIAENVIKEKKADFVSLGRPLLADPLWPNKVRENEIDDIIPCIGCHECLRRRRSGRYISCAVNPSCGKEDDYILKPAEEPKNVLIVGGGPGGLEAAIVAAKRGHKVVLWEKNTKLGGNLLPAMVPSFKKDLNELVEYLKAQVYKHGVTVRLMKEAKADEIIRLSPDVVIIATGSEPLNLPHQSEYTIMASDVLVGKKAVGKRVVVVGGGFLGCETAVFLSNQGKDVIIIEMLNDILIEQTPEMITQMTLKKLIKENNIKVVTNAIISKIEEKHILIKTEDLEENIQYDSLVLALGFKPIRKLGESLTGKVKIVISIGDAVQPRRVINAIWEGFHAALNL